MYLWPYAECHSDECSILYCDAECINDEYRHAEWHYSECRGAYYIADVILVLDLLFNLQKKFISSD
jgi:hypothetical protein